MKYPGGRPTAYSREILKKTQDYLKNFEKYGDTVPSVAGLSVHLQLSRPTIYDWASQEAKKEFSNMLQDILSKQEKELISNGLSGKFNSTITKLMLAKHGYTEKTDITSGDKPIPMSNVFVNGVQDSNSDKEDSETEKED